MMDATTWNDRAEAMQAELAPMPLEAAIAWGHGTFGGMDNLLMRLTRNPDGSAADTAAAAATLGAWAACVGKFAAIVETKAPKPPKPVEPAA